MLVNATSIRAVFVSLSTHFHNALKAVGDAWRETAMPVPSTGKGNDYAWLSRFPKMKKWVGDKQIKALELGNYYKANEDWETTICVDRNDIDDDQLGIYEPQAKMAGESAGELNGDIVADLQNNAFVEVGIDGVTFYNAAHPLTSAGGVVTTYSNLGSVALSAATYADVVASYGAARIAIMGYKDEEGQPLNLVPDLLEVPPALEATANIIATALKLADDSPNPYQGTCRVRVNPRLTSSTAWFLHVTNKATLKHLIVQIRKAPVFVSQTSMENDAVFNRREYHFGAEARATGVYGFWQLSWGSTGTG
jgi:phage major head subunit gpT-like protein